MRKLLVVVVALALVASACGGGDSCGAIADDTIDLFQDFIDEMSSLSLEDAASGADPEFIDRFETDTEALAARATEAGCSDAQMEDLLADRADRLTSDSEIGRAIIESLRIEG